MGLRCPYAGLLQAAAALGVGVGIGFLVQGAAGTRMLRPAVPHSARRVSGMALAPLCHDPRGCGCRRRALPGRLAVAALPALARLFNEWLWTNNFGRFLGRNQLGPKSVPGQYLGVLVWYALPAWPLAAWAIWNGRREIRAQPALHLPLTAFLVIFAVLSLSRDARDLYAMPMLVPLALLAVPGLLTLRRGASNALLWFSVLFFAFFLLVGWFYWIALDIEFPARLHRHLLRMQPGYTSVLQLVRVHAGVALHRRMGLDSRVHTPQSRAPAGVLVGRNDDGMGACC